MTEISNKTGDVEPPSYWLASMSGFCIGILGAMALHFFPDHIWLHISVPALVGLISGLLGTYFSIEPYELMKDKMGQDTGDNKEETCSELKIQELEARLGHIATDLARHAAELGEDGIKIAEAAELVRKEAIHLSPETK